MAQKAELTPEERKRQAIWAEVGGWKKKGVERGESWRHQLNNFWARLPGDDFLEGNLYMQMTASFGGRDSLDKVHTKQSGSSRLLLSQTPRELLVTIKQAIERCPGVELKEILRLQTLHWSFYHKLKWYKGMPKDEEEMWEKNLKKAIELMDTLYNYVLPLYVELRVMGYSHVDLVR